MIKHTRREARDFIIGKRRIFWAQRWILSWALCVVLCAFLSGCATINPATGKQEFLILTTPAEVMLGQEVNASLQGSEKFSKNKADLRRLSRIGQKVVQVSDRQDYQYQFYLIDKDEMNAFTVPGGHVYFYTGLLRALHSDDEVAAVLAHEIGHCAAHHVAKKFQMSLGYNIIGSMVFGSIQNELAVRIAKLGADTLMNIGMSAYSREDEYQADRLGVKYMYLAGFDPNGMITTFEVLGKASKGDDNDWMLLRSHPRLSDRIEAVKKEIAVVQTKY
ncbi:MAG: M48 family metalloprotease [Candidatus Omnitrophica bacterium]|nr:M48 family metalloprotease [Candidatus Omnitrophota bacterium]